MEKSHEGQDRPLRKLEDHISDYDQSRFRTTTAIEIRRDEIANEKEELEAKYRRLMRYAEQIQTQIDENDELIQVCDQLIAEEREAARRFGERVGSLLRRDGLVIENDEFDNDSAIMEEDADETERSPRLQVVREQAPETAPIDRVASGDVVPTKASEHTRIGNILKAAPIRKTDQKPGRRNN